MKTVSSAIVSAPSPLLLRFLKSQVDNVCFFTPNSGHTAHSCSSSGTTLLKGLTTCKSQSSRSFCISHRNQATVESSLLNFDFLRPELKPGRFQSFPPTAKTRRDLIRLLSGANALRHASGDGQTLLKRLWHLKKRDPNNDLKPGDLPPLPAFLDPTDGTTLGRSSAKGPDGLKLRCTEVDENGKVTFTSGEFKKSELIAKYGLLPRDLRKIDSSLLPHILVRPSAILINLLHLRALIRHDHVLVFDTYGSVNTHIQSQFMYDLEGRLSRHSSRQAGGLPYEFRAIEACLISVTSALESEFEGVREPVVKVLRELEIDIDREKLRHLLVYSKKLGTFEQKARLVRDAIDDLLEADDDLAAMYLTERAQGKIRDEEDHTEVEMLLESYHKVCDEIVQVSGNLISNIRNTEEIVKAILDANRNSLMLLDLKFSIGTLGIGSGAFVASLYGMNLKNFIEESDLGFTGVSAFSFVLAAIVCSYGMKKLSKVQRVSMWGEQGHRSKGSWRDVDPMPALPGESREDRIKRIRAARHEAMKDSSSEARRSYYEGGALPPAVIQPPKRK